MLAEVFAEIDMHMLGTVAHLFGVALGAGGAFVSDALFIKAIRDARITPTEMGFLKVASHFVIGGLALLVVSGLVLFLFDPVGLLASGKFLAKMTVIAVIVLNGVVLHAVHMPRITRHLGEHLTSSDEFFRTRPFMFASGAVSFVSWVFALLFGAIGRVSFSYGLLMGAYIVALLIGIAVAIYMGSRVLPHHRNR